MIPLDVSVSNVIFRIFVMRKITLMTEIHWHFLDVDKTTDKIKSLHHLTARCIFQVTES